jgi:hypothetical protein
LPLHRKWAKSTDASNPVSRLARSYLKSYQTFQTCLQQKKSNLIFSSSSTLSNLFHPALKTKFYQSTTKLIRTNRSWETSKTKFHKIEIKSTNKKKNSLLRKNNLTFFNKNTQLCHPMNRFCKPKNNKWKSMKKSVWKSKKNKIFTKNKNSMSKISNQNSIHVPTSKSYSKKFSNWKQKNRY